MGSSLKLFSPMLYIISLAWLGFEIALLKRLICNWIEKARICLNACWYQRAPSGFFWGAPNSFSHGSAGNPSAGALNIRPVTSFVPQGGAKSFPRGAQLFLTLSNIFKLRPTHFSRGAKIFLRGASLPLVTGLLNILKMDKNWTDL